MLEITEGQTDGYWDVRTRHMDEILALILNPSVLITELHYVCLHGTTRESLNGF
jgi:hypothetical protein